jgi:hypothetical protein
MFGFTCENISIYLETKTKLSLLKQQEGSFRTPRYKELCELLQEKIKEYYINDYF